MRPFGVMRGVATNCSTASLKAMDVAPDLVACWYGISTPVSMVAGCLSVVTTFGRATISASPASTEAESSTSSHSAEAATVPETAAAPSAMATPVRSVVPSAASSFLPGIVSAAQLHTPADAHLLGEVAVGVDDAGFDLHLPHGNVQALDHVLHGGEIGSGVGEYQGVGAFVHQHEATLGEGERRIAAEQRRQRPGIGVANAHEARLQRSEGRQGVARFGFQTLPFGKDRDRRHQQHVAAAPLAEAVGGEHDVQRLVPRHVHQAQRHVASHVVANDEVQAGEIGDLLQHAVDGNALQVERQRRTGEGGRGFAGLRFAIFGGSLGFSRREPGAERDDEHGGGWRFPFHSAVPPG